MALSFGYEYIVAAPNVSYQLNKFLQNILGIYYYPSCIKYIFLLSTARRSRQRINGNFET